MSIGENYFLDTLIILNKCKKLLVSSFKFEIRIYKFPKMLKTLEMVGNVITIFRRSKIVFTFCFGAEINSTLSTINTLTRCFPVNSKDVVQSLCTLGGCTNEDQAVVREKQV